MISSVPTISTETCASRIAHPQCWLFFFVPREGAVFICMIAAFVNTNYEGGMGTLLSTTNHHHTLFNQGISEARIESRGGDAFSPFPYLGVAFVCIFGQGDMDERQV